MAYLLLTSFAMVIKISININENNCCFNNNNYLYSQMRLWLQKV